jgi:transcriptional regulator with XRE-family HTH domain/tetratricopeptide (TPR) repeat protein
VTEQWMSFGPELRRLRVAADVSLTRLAGLLHYSKGHVSKVETGLKRPTPELAQRCDALLGAQGALAALVPVPSSRSVAREAMARRAIDDGEVWSMNVAPDGTSWCRLLDRRQFLAAGATSVLGLGFNDRDVSGAARQTASLEGFRALFDQFRQLGQTVSPAVVLPALIAQTQTVQGVAAQSDARMQCRALTLAARYAEYVGWMCQEAGNDEAAMWWTDRAVELAAAGGDRDLASYALVRRALMALYRNDAAETLKLSRSAQLDSVLPRIRGLAAQREAQGHALAGDRDACLRCLDTARGLITSAPSDPAPMLGSTNLADSVAMITGWCLYDLGRPEEAGEILDREIARLPPDALRSHTRYGIRRAMAHAAAGEIEHACEITELLLGGVGLVGSATIRTDLRRLARTLSRFRTTRAVRGLSPQLVAALPGPAA